MERLKSCETRPVEVVNFSFDNPNAWFHNDKRYSRSFICYAGLLSEPRGAQKLVNYVWNSDQYHLTSVIKNPSGSLRSVMPAASGFLYPRLYTGYIGIFTYYYYYYYYLLLLLLFFLC
jgi:hypothetical protein